MDRLLDLTGQVYGWLTVVGRGEPPAGQEHRLSYWECRCQCQRIRIVRSDALRNSSVRSCVGCAVSYKLRGIFSTAVTVTEISNRGSTTHFGTNAKT